MNLFATAVLERMVAGNSCFLAVDVSVASGGRTDAAKQTEDAG